MLLGFRLRSWCLLPSPLLFPLPVFLNPWARSLSDTTPAGWCSPASTTVSRRGHLHTRPSTGADPKSPSRWVPRHWGPFLGGPYGESPLFLQLSVIQSCAQIYAHTEHGDHSPSKCVFYFTGCFEDSRWILFLSPVTQNNYRHTVGALQKRSPLGRV